jgi:F0F1-type ATP synthase membrane subunit b/b'
MDWDLIIKFLVLTAVISAGLIFALHRALISSVDGAKQRLDKEADAARARQAELNQKVKEADEELARRKQELDAIEKKMKFELEASAGKEKESILNKARVEGEEIIAKAQASRDTIRREIEKTMELKIVDYSSKILSDILSDKARGGLDRQLSVEFVEKLKGVDMSKIGPDVNSADLVTATPVDSIVQANIEAVLTEKLKRKITLSPKTDGSIVGGAVLQFGSLLLDGSLKGSIRSSAVALKQDIEKS